VLQANLRDSDDFFSLNVKNLHTWGQGEVGNDGFSGYSGRGVGQNCGNSADVMFADISVYKAP